MSGCKPNCGGGCHDFSLRAERLPNLLAIDVVSGLLEQAIRNMTMRAASLESGMMSPEDYESARRKLVVWLAALFAGRNPHFEADSEWHKGGGLCDFLRERLADPSKSDGAILERAAELFSDDANEVAHQFVNAQGSAEADRARTQIATLWAHLFTGAPVEF